MEPGAVLAERYELEERIGRGGMADVYRATDRALDRPVAVKVLRTFTADDADRARFTAEARTLAGLNHPGLVMVLDAGTAEDHPYLVMHLVDGPSLSDRIGEGPLPPSAVARIGRQVADALAYVHANGVVHRDVKPGNVLLGAHGRAWLTDFGIARLLHDAARHTATGTMVGSPAYLSPEQLRGDDVGPAADVYSLGLVLLEALTGERVYPGSGVEAAMVRLSRPPSLPDDLPPGWRDLLRAMTSLEPSARPDPAQVSQAVDGLERGETPTVAYAAAPADGTKVLTRVAPAPTPQPRPDPAPAAAPSEASAKQGRSWLPIALTAVGLVLAVLLAVVLLDGLDTGPGTAIPDGVPAELQEPLRRLHEAVAG